MKYIRNLTFAQLIRYMHKATSTHGRTTQRDTISDIADLQECYENAIKRNSYVERFWGIKYDGTIMCRTCDFGVFENNIIDRYRILWSEHSNWAIEEL